MVESADTAEPAESAETTPNLERVDVLIAGGGPAGTSAAFRACELGMSVLVVDYDDLMKRIRDYAKDKLILPSFGGGGRMCFPAGGDLISCLHFEPIDKDDMCERWKALYAEHEIQTRVGAELTDLSGLGGSERGGYRATLWNHRTRESEICEAAHVVLALGRGVPRRFDIPGNTDGIAYRLTEPENYVGRPACVIGGGTSAAEAVIAISEAKSRAADATSIYWSYRGDKMPRISKALADAFFTAYVGNGNIRYHRRSEPVAVFTGDDREEVLAIRVDRREMEGRPSELSMLEFAKDQCVACIGEDIPEALLDSFGVNAVTGGPKNRKRMVVNRYLETCRPNLYMVGDLLSQAYFETDDFDADPSDFREVKHRGNIKSALRDGVLVAQVIGQRLDGKKEIDITVEEAAADGPSAQTSAQRRGSPRKSPESGQRLDRDGGDREAVLIRVLPTGVEEQEHRLSLDGLTTIGREGCDLSFPDDATLSGAHASIVHTDEGYLLRDDGSSTGVFLKAEPARKLEAGDGDLLRVGRQFLLLTTRSSEPLVIHYDASGVEVGRHELSSKPIVLGRAAPDVVLDAGDATLSRRHLALSAVDSRILIKDLKSANGTYLKIRAARRLEHGDRIRVGQQAFVFSEDAAASLDAGLEPGAAPGPAPTPGPLPEPALDGNQAEAGDGPQVTFRSSGSSGGGEGQTVAVEPGASVCEAAEGGGVPITAECHSGICGSDPVRIVSGAENVGEMSDQERETLEEICELEAGPCRLACMLRIKGPVEVEIIE